MAGQSGGKRGRKAGRQSRNKTQIRYWESGRMATRKVRNIVRSTDMKWAEALKLWEAKRRRHKGTVNVRAIEKACTQKGSRR